MSPDINYSEYKVSHLRAITYLLTGLQDWERIFPVKMMSQENQKL